MNNYDVRDISLAPSGHRKIEWVKNNMPLLSALEEDFKRDRPFEGLKISLRISAWYLLQEEHRCL